MTKWNTEMSPQKLWTNHIEKKINFVYTFILVYLLKLLDRKLKQAYDKDLHV